MPLGPISEYKTDGIAQENQLLTFSNRTAKPPFVGSNPTRASNPFRVRPGDMGYLCLRPLILGGSPAFLSAHYYAA